tara:strand:- start:178 stop:411 length:234 start_codon:yes stop_codon:yes gene_type:complete
MLRFLAVLLGTTSVLIFDATGGMKTACVRRKSRETVAAMKDLKRRIGDMSARDQEYLQYWIRIGEPRITDDRCGSDG